MKPLVNLDALTESRELSHGGNFAARLFPIAPVVGAKKLGYNLTVVPSGKRAFPFHNHHANEEMFFIVSGSGRLRFGAEEYDVRAGDVVACPSGDASVAHQLINTGEVELRYLAVSTAIDTDVYQYPDSGKVGATGGRVPATWPPQASFQSKFFVESAHVDYWQGE